MNHTFSTVVAIYPVCSNLSPVLACDFLQLIICDYYVESFKYWGVGDVANLSPFWEEMALPAIRFAKPQVKRVELGACLPTT